VLCQYRLGAKPKMVQVVVLVVRLSLLQYLALVIALRLAARQGATSYPAHTVVERRRRIDEVLSQGAGVLKKRDEGDAVFATWTRFGPCTSEVNCMNYTSHLVPITTGLEDGCSRSANVRDAPFWSPSRYCCRCQPSRKPYIL